MKTKMMISILLILLCYLLSNAQIKNLPTTITGSWDVWIPGAVTYHQKSDAIYQRYEPGAAMRTLKINNKGSFDWEIPKDPYRKYAHGMQKIVNDISEFRIYQRIPMTSGIRKVPMN